MTITELIVVMAISLTLFAIGTIALIRPQQKANIDSSINILISDIKLQQTKAMTSDSAFDQAIHFENDSYTLFEGNTYNAADTSNFTVNLEGEVTINDINLANQNLIFTKGSGETSLVNPENIFDVTQNQSSETVNITINKYGAIEKN